MLKRFTILLLLIINCICACAQDANFSQFFSSPLTLNPANTGNFNGSLRLAGNFRNQWASFNNAFSTTTFSVDAPILLTKMAPYNRLSIGLNALTDQSGNGLLKQNYLAGSFAFKKGFDADARHSLSLGFQAAYGSANFNSSLAKFEDQLTPGGFLLSTSEPLQISNTYKKIVDLNSGLIYNASNEKGRSFYIGAAVNHILEPVTTNLNSDYYTKRRYTVHGGGYFPVGENATVHASFQFQQQGDYREIILGGAASYFINGKSTSYYELYLGTWLRYNDAIIPYVGVEYNLLRFGFSYDINYSSDKTAGTYYRTAEFSIIKVFNSNKENVINCPKF
jgi:type IX secretion system PorP/SprF family membrane protein